MSKKENRTVQFNDKPMSVRRVIAYILGMFVMSLGISFAVKSQLGVSPVTSVPYVFARVLGVSVGVGTIIIYCVYLLLELCIYRRKFKLTYLIQIPAAFVFGWFIDLTTLLITPINHNEVFLLQLLFVILGILLLGVGVRVYLTADIMAIPADALAVAIAWASNKPLHRCKLLFDCCSLALSLIVSLLFFRDIEGIWLGTILAALGVGQALRLFTFLLEKRLKKFLFGTPDEATPASA